MIDRGTIANAEQINFMAISFSILTLPNRGSHRLEQLCWPAFARAFPEKLQPRNFAASDLISVVVVRRGQVILKNAVGDSPNPFAPCRGTSHLPAACVS